MTRVFLAAGVAAIAIAAPASAKPDRVHGNSAQSVERPQRAERQQQVRVERQAPRMERQQMRVERQAQRVDRPQRMERQAQRVERPQRMERQAQRVERQARVERAPRVERQAQRVERQQVENRHVERQQVRNERIQQAQNRVDRQQVRVDRNVAQTRMADRHDLRAERQMANIDSRNARQELRAQRQLHALDLRQDRRTLNALRAADVRTFESSRLAALTPRTTIIAPTQAVRYVGQPLNVLGDSVRLVAVPQQISYLYPDTPDYYYRYGSGYLYQVDRGTNLIAALLPLLAGGYMPGSYLPSSYMNSYVPSYYGLNSFYPASYNGYDYGYGYQNLCNRYANGVIYRVDCYSGMIVDVVPMYAGGYGVGQMLPSAYSTYNVPYQYRSMYYNTADSGYWYGPGAIYQYDPSTSLITSVAALLSPGFSVGQPLPMGYSTYNVPYAYRTTYYDTPDAWYRYNNGYIYRVDPATQLVSAVVASILT